MPRRGMKVAHLTTVDLSLRYLIMPQLLAVLDEGGEVLGISADGPWVPELERAGIRHIALKSSTRSMNIIADARSAWELWKILRAERPDVLHTHNPKPGLYGRVLGRLAGVPIVINTVHGLYATEDDPLVKRAVVYTLEAIAARCSDMELVQSSEDVDLLTRLHISPSHKTRLLGNGVDLDRFNRDRIPEDEIAATRKTWGATEGSIVVGVVGRLVLEKGFLEFFEAVASLDKRYVVVVIGPSDPEKSDAVPAATIEAAEANGVTFLGMREDVERLYPAMDIFVLPSHREGFPRAAMEAAASGVPVIATDIRGCRQVVDHESNGLLIPVSDSKAIVEAITRIGSDSDLRLAMAKAARIKSESDFDERSVVDKVMSAYREVAAQKSISLGDGHPT